MAVSKRVKSVICLWLLLLIYLPGCEDFIQTNVYLALQVQLGPSMTAGSNEEPKRIVLSIGDKLLFSVKVEAQCDLNNGIISADLRQGFEDNEILLSNDAFVSVKETDAKWLITDGNKVYTVKKQEDELNIYGDNSRNLPIIKGEYTEYGITLDSFGEIIVKVEVIGDKGNCIWQAEKSVYIEKSGVTYVTFSFPHDQGSGE